MCACVVDRVDHACVQNSISLPDAILLVENHHHHRDMGEGLIVKSLTSHT